MESATFMTSFMLCDTRITATPCPASRRTRWRTCSVWATPSAAVGSSRMTIFDFQSTDLAIATVWRWPPDRLATSCRTDRIVRTDSVASACCASLSIEFSSSVRSRVTSSRPRNMFSTMSRLSQRARSWYTISTPSSAASRGPCTLRGVPSTISWPSSTR